MTTAAARPPLSEAQVQQLPAPFAIALLGHMPAKKNNWTPRKGGGIFLDKASQAEINGLIIQATSIARNWGVHKLEHPRLRITFYVRDRRGDRDNKLSTLLDVLQKAGIIANDNVRRFNGEVTLMPAVVDKNEKTVVEIW